MKKYLSLLLFWAFTSCAQKPDLKDIQQTVFGDLPIGIKKKEYNKQFQSIAGSSMSITGSTKYPYFKLEKRDIVDYRMTLLYPHAFQNKDSVITRIVFYLYQIKFPSMEVVESPSITPEQKKILFKVAGENQDRLDFLTQEFDTRGSIDSQFLFYLPNVAQGSNYISLERDIASYLQQKYGKQTATNTAGNEYDKYDYLFFKEQIWKTDKLNIRLVRKRYPFNQAELSDEFYMVLIYEYNNATRKKYGLDKEGDLTQTF